MKKTGADRPMFICRDCKRVTRGYDRCVFYCEHDEDRPSSARRLLEGRRIDTGTIVTTGEYEPPESHWAQAYTEPSDEELGFGHVV